MTIDEQLEWYDGLADVAIDVMIKELTELREVIKRRGRARMKGIGAETYGSVNWYRPSGDARLEGIDEGADWVVYTVQRLRAEMLEMAVFSAMYETA